MFLPTEPHLYRRDSSLSVNSTQKETLIVACVYAVVIGILWHVPFLRWLIYPFKLLTVGFHEFSHALAGKLTGAKIESIRLDPHEGGETRMRGGWSFISLPAGYLGSSLIGAIFIAVGFDSFASKIACFVIAASFLICIYWARRDWLCYLLIIIFSALLVAFWFINHGIYLRYVILFIGVMSCLYSIWDIIDDTLIRKVASSDAVQMSYAFKCIPSRGWGFIWLLQSVGFFACGIIVGIAAFKYEDQRARADMFLST
ncbi:hypothetical protein WALSEDRAFT_62743 [Wallemia mellicola CBS 633.66]|uniref:Peptidase M50B-like-domain-containing protein n=1 Tax=Wallemia mellicola (strain ATCC MYA-4683 / CBS 633.66) TaxID=671144 RepID=I4YHD4_WALMC|nr:hypothetical protein WALSEDRAFT_62743 [Wallemia mellicola CBS 633.66]EIM23376.1 hypothetical protein WALSEDRAFT_62743 [Wallemia mellicola CBS 633.66]|eukprot:XP_006956757.1 hypothetical protein WALSEDRAFT_62743 [Wallemia mellicola CBS 633.66]